MGGSFGVCEERREGKSNPGRLPGGGWAGGWGYSGPAGLETGEP